MSRGTSSKPNPLVPFHKNPPEMYYITIQSAMPASMMKNHERPTSPEKNNTTIAHLVSTRCWASLEKLLASTPSSSILMDDPTLQNNVTSGIAVHLAARFQAPLRIISLLSQAYPHSLSSTDISGRNPIHVAAKWGATPDVIAYLIKANPSAAGVPDSTGKTPMHYVGKCYLQHFNSSLYGCDDSMLKVVRLLKKAAPMSVNLEDDEGMNAIEYALVSDANLEVINSMQRACRDDWRERSKGGSIPADCNSNDDATASQPMQLGRRRHQDLVRDIETMSLKLQGQHVGIDKKLSNERIHVHRSSTSTANTRAARMA